MTTPCGSVAALPKRGWSEWKALSLFWMLSHVTGYIFSLSMFAGVVVLI